MLNRILRMFEQTDAITVLKEKLEPTDLQSLLLEIFRVRAGNVTIPKLLWQYQNNRFVTPSTVDYRKILELDTLAFSLLPAGYQALELAPVSPLGTCSALAPTDQNKVLSTIRNTEVNADSTNSLALEYAAQRRQQKNSVENLKLAASQRVVRAQKFTNVKGVLAHFRLLSLCSGGQRKVGISAELEAVTEQLHYYLKLLAAVEQMAIFAPSPRIDILVYDEQWLEAIAKYFTYSTVAGTRISVQLFEGKQSYYQLLRYNIYATNTLGEEYFLCDGGFTDWTRRLLGNNKEWFLISGVGTERLITCFEENYHGEID
ncbi:MAG: hypothetical protein WCP79_03205 [Bacillota bacterium]